MFDQRLWQLSWLDLFACHMSAYLHTWCRHPEASCFPGQTSFNCIGHTINVTFTGSNWELCARHKTHLPREARGTKISKRFEKFFLWIDRVALFTHLIELSGCKSYCSQVYFTGIGWYLMHFVGALEPWSLTWLSKNASSRSLASEMTASWSSWAILGLEVTIHGKDEMTWRLWSVWSDRMTGWQEMISCDMKLSSLVVVLWRLEHLSVFQENLPPFQIVFLRFSAAALVLLPVLLFQGRSCLARLLDSVSL